MRDKKSFERDFPGLKGAPYRITSPQSEKYNCISWAIGETKMVCWPGSSIFHYWRRRIPRNLAVSKFKRFFLLYSFEICSDGELETGWEKVALYAKGDVSNHAVRQLPDGNWTSKMDEDEDIEIPDPSVLEGDEYGKVVLYFKRKIGA